MKFKSLLISGLCLIGFAMTSCDDQEEAKYTPAAPEESPEAYFSPLSETSAEINDETTQIVIPVYRATKEGASTVQVICTVNDATPFTIPTTVTFADQADEADFVIGVDVMKLMSGVDYDFKLTIGDGVDTPYCLKTLSYLVTYSTWEDVVGPNGETMGTWIDDLISGLYNLTPTANPSWPVQIQQSPSVKGLYRVVNPYKNFQLNGMYDRNYDTDHYLYFNASNPNGVFMCTKTGAVLEADGSYPIFTSGINIGGDGWFEIVGYYNYGASIGKESAAQAYLGKLTNGVMTFPKQGLVVAETEWNGGAAAGAFYVGNKNEKWRLIFPGCVDETPEEPEWDAIGKAEFYDPFVTAAYGITGQHWSVDVERNIENPTLFRMVNPYKSGVMIVDGAPFGEEGLIDLGSDYDGDMYVEFDCDDPTCVFIPMQDCGYIDAEDGMFTILNAAYYYAVAEQYTNAQIISGGYADTYDTSTFTVNIGAGHAWYNLGESSDEETANAIYSTSAAGKIVMTDEAAATAKLSIASAYSYATKFRNLLAASGLNVEKHYQLGHVKKMAKSSKKFKMVKSLRK